MSHHYIQDSALLRVVRQVIPAGKARDFAVDAIERFLSRQPRSPELIGTTAAAKLLGIQPPHVSRLRDQGRMPEAVRVEGGNDVFIRDEVEQLARELRAEREDRARRRAARQEATS